MSRPADTSVSDICHFCGLHSAVSAVYNFVQVVVLKIELVKFLSSVNVQTGSNKINVAYSCINIDLDVVVGFLITLKAAYLF